MCNTAWELASGQVACGELDHSRDLTQVSVGSPSPFTYVLFFVDTCVV